MAVELQALDLISIFTILQPITGIVLKDHFVTLCIQSWTDRAWPSSLYHSVKDDTMYLALSPCPREAPDKRSQHFYATNFLPFLAILLRRIGCCWLFSNLSNNTQHAATLRNRVAKRAQHVTPNNFMICCVEMLRSFCWGSTKRFSLKTY